ncbi:MAG: biotin--[acetyl-CoA-carboxylase] ligase [Myxococcales bacterium]|nr:biotin--[acetyl-CoA-carboxylase] ligase [Myxococcales bacterium]
MAAREWGLAPDRILAELSRLHAQLGRPLTVLVSTASTNDDARAEAREGAPHGAMVVSDHQSAGRGRGGHAWHSPPGANVYLSLVWRPSIDTALLAPLALAAGIAVARTVDAELASASPHAPRAERRMMPPRVSIKWPNDVFVGERKIAGVLLESFSIGQRTVVIIGVGLNVAALAFPPEITASATSIALEVPGANLDRSVIVARLAHHLELACGAFEAGGLIALSGELGARDFLRGRRISVGERSGLGAGIDPAGRLMITADDGATHAILSGEVDWQ